MDNTVFTSLTGLVVSIIGFALTAVITIAGFVLGATVGLSLYTRFVLGGGSAGSDIPKGAIVYRDRDGNERVNY